MALTFTVGNPDEVFIESFVQQVKNTLASHFSGIVLDSDEEAYRSEELGWSGWGLLQERAIEAIGADAAPHFLSMEAWSGCYVPAETEPGSFQFEGEDSPLAVASLPALVNELENLGSNLGWPIDDNGLRELGEKYQDDDLIDDDMDIQTYAQLLLAAHHAQRRRQVLWVVK